MTDLRKHVLVGLLALVATTARAADDDTAPPDADTGLAPEAPAPTVPEEPVPTASEEPLPTDTGEGSEPAGDEDEFIDDDVEEVVIKAEDRLVPERGAGDIRVDVDPVRAVPRASAGQMLTLAPGVFLTQTGGTGHADQVFLRGFDAREGQDIAFSVEGVPLNEVANPHGHGLTDLHFIIPEAVQRLRVVEGPFDPTQGDFAVAGSAEYTLGLSDPGLLLKAEYGSFQSWRAVVGWRAASSPHTPFFVGEVFSTRGYGENRGALRGSAIARIGGGDTDALHWHALATVYGTSYDSAGLLRRDDIDAGRIDFYGTYDTHQGGSAQRALLGAGLDGRVGTTRWALSAFGGLKGMRDKENFTGFLLDERRPGESDHGQRGDLLETRYSARTLGLQALARTTASAGAVHGAWGGGVFGRYDDVDGTARRLRDQDLVPYRTELDYALRQADIALWVDGELEWGPVTVRGGARAEMLYYELFDRCADKDGWYPGIERDEVNCPTTDRYGPRLEEAARSASGLGLGPRGSVDLTLVPGAVRLTASAGKGIRSLEATSLSDGEKAPFATVVAGEAGLVLDHLFGGGAATERIVAFGTHVDKDLVFDEEKGRNVIAGETMRWGALAQSEVTWRGLTARNSLTWTHAVFGDDIPLQYSYYNSDRVPGMLVPYVPSVVVRSDLAYTWSPGRGVQLAHGVGIGWIAPRPLPQSQRSDAVFTVDLGTSVRWGPFEVGGEVTNLLDRRYALAEYNFSSWFPEVSGTDFPTRVPTRQVSPGPPRAFVVSLTVRPDLRPPAKKVAPADLGSPPDDGAPVEEVP